MNKEKNKSYPIQTNKSTFILGRKNKDDTNQGLLEIGRYYALDGSLGASVSLDIMHPHIIFICGKRGYGKSYTLGVILEEIQRLKKSLKSNLSVILIDTLGIFWTMQFPNSSNKELLNQWNLTPKGFSLKLFTTSESIEQYTKMKIPTHALQIKPASLSPFDWCTLFNIQPYGEIGSLLFTTILEMKEKNISYSISDIIKQIWKQKQTPDKKKTSAENYLRMAATWNIFHKDGIEFTDLINPGTLTLIDLSMVPEQQLKILITGLISDALFELRVQARKTLEYTRITTQKESIAHQPLILLALDEAHLFLPKCFNHTCKKILIEKWLRQGRQPGLSLVLGTQLPGSIDPEVFSHSDLIICHRLTAQEDIKTLQTLRPTYIHEEIQETLKKIGQEKGVALIIDDISETTHILRIRPRKSWHGGEQPTLAMLQSNKTLSKGESSHACNG